MEKIVRLTKEFFFTLSFYRNPFAYLKNRLGLSGVGKIILRLKNGINYCINANTTEMRVIDEIWRVGVYDRLLTRIKENSIVIDIGANIGVFSVKAAEASKNVKVLSFEPFPRNFEMLKTNIALNKLEKRIQPFQAAVGQKGGKQTLFFRPGDSGGGSFKRYGNEAELSSVEVSTVTLEDIFSSNRIESCDFMKIDCEGAEEEILTTAPRDIFKKIRTMTIEWHYNLNRMTIDEFKLFLKNLGYNVDYNASTLTLYAWQ
ncbi:MAG: FkbM family methyltransferase [Parcubacteria group bacterium Gr01-1014_20]|nr:MAG: FkbM family methyltransferase [Parcubacteria group bacterium Gr01-1014_20]